MLARALPPADLETITQSPKASTKLPSLLETTTKEMNDTPSHAVKRYTKIQGINNNSTMMAEPNGEFVKFSDYDQVRKQRDELLEAAKRSLPAIKGYYKQAINLDGYIPDLQSAIEAAEKEGETV